MAPRRPTHESLAELFLVGIDQAANLTGAKVQFGGGRLDGRPAATFLVVHPPDLESFRNGINFPNLVERLPLIRSRRVSKSDFNPRPSSWRVKPCLDGQRWPDSHGICKSLDPGIPLHVRPEDEVAAGDLPLRFQPGATGLPEVEELQPQQTYRGITVLDRPLRDT
jgi:hypothetical protein